MASGGSTEVAAGYVSLYARMDGAQVASEITSALSGLNAASIASEMLGGIGSAADTLGTRLTVLGTAALIGATRLTGGLFDTISVAENTAIAFDTMLGSTDLAADAMSRLNEFAIKTPYEFDNIATSSKQLLAMGIDFDKQLDENGQGVLQWAGNWASALGLNDAGFSNVLTQFGHISAAGRIYTRNITTLSRNGIAAWQALSDYMGISIDEVRDLVQKGEVDAETALAAFEAYSNEHFLGTMDAMAHTMTGIMSNINDAIKVPIMSLRDTSAYKGLTDAMYDLTNPVRELVEALMPSVEVVFERATPFVRDFTDKIIALTDSLRKGNPDDLVRGLEAIAMILGSGPFLKGFGMLSNGLSGFLGMSADVGKGIVSYLYKPLTALSQVKWGESISGYFGTLKSGFDDLGTRAVSFGRIAASSLSETARTISFSLGSIVGEWAASLQGESNPLVRTMKGYVHWFGRTALPGPPSFEFTPFDDSMFAEMRAKTAEFWSAFSGLAKQSMRVVAQVTKPFATLLGATLKTGLTAFSQFAGVLVKGGSAFGIIALGATIAAGVFTAMGGDLVSLGAEIADVLGSVGGTVADMLGGFASGLSALTESGGIDTFFLSLTSGINGFVSQVGAQIPAVLGAIGAAFPQVLGNLIGMFQTYAPMVLAGAMQLFSGLVTGLTTVVAQLTPALPGIISSIAAAIVGNAPAILGAGVGLFSALVEAFVTTIPAVVGELPGLIDLLVSSLVNNFPNIMAGATELFNAIAEAIPVIVPLAIGALGRLLSTLVRSFPSWGPQFLSAMGNVLISLLNAIAQAIPGVLNAIRGLLRQGMNAIRNTDWSSLGSNLIRGFINGIRNMASAVLEAALGVVQSAASAVKSFLGIESPSRLFRGYGEMTMAGMALGIDKGADGVMNAMDSVMDGLVPNSVPGVGLGTYANGMGDRAFGSTAVTNNYYIDGNLVAADAVLASALDTVATRINGRTRMGTVV